MVYYGSISVILVLNNIFWNIIIMVHNHYCWWMMNDEWWWWTRKMTKNRFSMFSIKSRNKLKNVFFSTFSVLFGVFQLFSIVFRAFSEQSKNRLLDPKMTQNDPTSIFRLFHEKVEKSWKTCFFQLFHTFFYCFQYFYVHQSVKR